MHINHDQLAWLARAIVATLSEEIDCDEWLQRVGKLVELQSAGQPIPPDLKVVQQHIEVCQDCAEDFEALLQACIEKD